MKWIILILLGALVFFQIRGCGDKDGLMKLQNQTAPPSPEGGQRYDPAENPAPSEPELIHYQFENRPPPESGFKVDKLTGIVELPEDELRVARYLDQVPRVIGVRLELFKVRSTNADSFSLTAFTDALGQELQIIPSPAGLPVITVNYDIAGVLGKLSAENSNLDLDVVLNTDIQLINGHDYLYSQTDEQESVQITETDQRVITSTERRDVGLSLKLTAHIYEKASMIQYTITDEFPSSNTTRDQTTIEGHVLLSEFPVLVVNSLRESHLKTEQSLFNVIPLGYRSDKQTSNVYLIIRPIPAPRAIPIAQAVTPENLKQIAPPHLHRGAISDKRQRRQY